ncbi:MAG: hypothetical protein AB1384_06405 [Actinomycetota bacterium]
MTKEYLRASYFVQELEEANGNMHCDLVNMARYANISLGIMAKTSSSQDLDIDLYFHIRRTLDKLQREANRQSGLLDAMKKELMHARDDDRSVVPPCVLFDYEKTGTG